jgi:branched-subunit amino acid transport protein
MSLWITIAVAGFLTFATRLSFIYLVDKIAMPDWFRRALRFVPIAVLTAIVFPALLDRGGSLDMSIRNPQIWAGAAAVLVAWRTKSVILTLIAGMAALLVLQALL